MTFTNYGLEQFGSYMIGAAPSNPDYMAFGFGSDAFIGTQAHLGSEFLRKSITWTFFENSARGTVSLSSTDANGSNIQEFGLAQGASVGSDVMARVLSAIGEKNNAFDVDISFSTKFRRG